MINRLQLIRNVGVFDSVNGAANIALARLTLIYAENGRGKTTLGAILRSLATGDPIPIAERKRLAAQNPPHVILDCDGGPPAAMFENNAWNRTIPNMGVFDDVFVDDNVCSGLAVANEHREKLHELILGAQGVILARNLQTLADQITAHNAALRTREAAIPTAERSSISVDEFCALPNRADIDTAIQAAERNLAAVREQDPIRNTGLFQAIVLPGFDAGTTGEVLEKDLPRLDAAAAAQVQAHLAELGQGGEAWVADGMQRAESVAPEGGTASCPFCAQDLRGSPVMNHYRAYFSAAYTALKREIADAISEVNGSHGGEVVAAFERAVRIAVERRQFWSRFCDVPEIAVDTAVVARDWQAARDAVLVALQAKQSSPLERMSLDADARAAIAAFEAHQRAIGEMSRSLQQANTAIGNVKEGAAAGNPAAIAADLARVKAIEARYAPATAALCDAYTQEKTAKAATEVRRDQARTALDNHRATVFPAYQAAINVYLGRFNAGFRIEGVAPTNPGGRPSCSYCLVINNTQVLVGVGNPTPGTPTFKNTMSSGDRNTLALAFFFASLDLDPTLADKIVVVDDPMTSLDDHRSLATVQEVRSLSTRAEQVIVLSHDKPFLCKVWEGANRQACVALAVARDATGSTITVWPVNEDCVTEYDRQHSGLREYVRANAGSSREVARDLRHVLEGFLRRACPEHFLPGEVLGHFRRRIRERQPTDPDILSAAVVTELDAISEYANKFHHDTNPDWETEAINDAELRGWAERTLVFVRK